MTTDARRLAHRFWKALGAPSLYQDGQTAWAWEKVAHRILRGHSLDQATEVVEHALKTDSFWTERIHGTHKDPFEFFAEHYGTIESQLEGFKKGLEADRRKAEKRAAARKSGAQDEGKPEYRKKPGSEIVKKDKVVKI